MAAADRPMRRGLESQDLTGWELVGLLAWYPLGTVCLMLTIDHHRSSFGLAVGFVLYLVGSTAWTLVLVRASRRRRRRLAATDEAPVRPAADG